MGFDPSTADPPVVATLARNPTRVRTVRRPARKQPRLPSLRSLEAVVRVIVRIVVVGALLAMITWPERHVVIGHIPHHAGRRIWAFVDPPGEGVKLFKSLESVARYLKVTQRRFYVRAAPEEHLRTPTCSDLLFFRDSSFDVIRRPRWRRGLRWF